MLSLVAARAQSLVLFGTLQTGLACYVYSQYQPSSMIEGPLPSAIPRGSRFGAHEQYPTHIAETMSNSKGQSPCLVASFLEASCFPPDPTVRALGEVGGAYAGPASADDANPCVCSTVTYSLLAACALCQSGSSPIPISSWPVFSQQCPGESTFVGVFTQPVSSGTEIPAWPKAALTDAGAFDPAAAFALAFKASQSSSASLAASRSPSPLHLTTGASLSSVHFSAPSSLATATSISGATSPSSSDSQKKSNAAAIAGGVVGGVVLVLLGGVLLMCTMRRRACRAKGLNGTGGEAGVLSRSRTFESVTVQEHGVVAMKGGECAEFADKKGQRVVVRLNLRTYPSLAVYNPDDPETFPSPDPPPKDEKKLGKSRRKNRGLFHDPAIVALGVTPQFTYFGRPELS
ncbi:uncharacterized protein BXZ73DRAFT_98221 [Epithele typhae]|uniref:uncharacterized protein n=1 Tax=Epithele typhae TaxID=378194 RepID=UPI00200820C2|nr:uncharacterized protein BXZ73DRAFT_98221 [Epithele typhae]KAH9941833.1 hypothetical protein BXZ73DRAFT_98221 [Epithele typhae]